MPNNIFSKTTKTLMATAPIAVLAFILIGIWLGKGGLQKISGKAQGAKKLVANTATNTIEFLTTDSEGRSVRVQKQISAN